MTVFKLFHILCRPKVGNTSTQYWTVRGIWDTAKVGIWKKKFSLEGKIPASKFPTGSVFSPTPAVHRCTRLGSFQHRKQMASSLSFYFLHQMDNLSLSYTNVQFGIMEDPEIPVQQGGNTFQNPEGSYCPPLIPGEIKSDVSISRFGRFLGQNSESSQVE